TGELEPAIAEVEILPDGTAAGTHGQHTTFFPVDIGNGVIRLVEPDGQEIRSEPLCLSYWDGTNYVVIAGLTNSVGELVSSNQVLYPDAFGKGASLLYTYTRAGLEQDVVLEQQPPTPQSLGLNEDTARLQVMTEFFNAPQPAVKARTVSTTAGEVEDDSLTFGTMSMVSGKAFVLGKAAPSVGIERRWVTDDGRQILIEEVPVTSINDDLANLPMGRTSSRKHNSRRYVVSRTPVFPPQRHWRVSERHPARIARTAQASRGLVLDYNIVNGNLTNYVFRGDSTYYVSGSVNLFGGTFEGGTVIKFAPSGPWNWYPTGPTINLQDGYQYNWLVGEDRPVIMTAKDDNTIGNEISGSSGTPSGYYGFPALTISAAQPPIISHFRISWAEQAISVFNTTNTFYDGQFVNCLNGITGGYSAADFRNVLFANVYTNFDNFAYGSMDVQNATFKGSASLLGEIGQPGFSISLTNCILANVTNIGTGTIAGAYNGFYNSPVFGSGLTNQFYPFQTVGGGSYYLTNGLSNAFRGAGTTNIDPVLLADLQGRTTYGPFVCDETNISSLVTLNPYAARDTNSTVNGTVDLGWHYEPIDFAFGGCSLKSNLTVTAGTAVGCFDDSGYGISLGNGAVLALNGTAMQPCLFAFADMIQEGNGNWTGGEGGGNSGAFYFTGSVQSSPPLVSSTFTKYMADNYRAFFDSTSWGAGIFKNCEFYNITASAYKLNYLTFTNCLFFRASLSFWDTYVLNFTNENCTYYDGQLALARISGAGGDSSSF
ncbi:MAG TPA: hypothetical protein VGY98_09515, partial [Verrucomicrobiae bacterium]|nr:hypothetical protein [Verrucomicrobiae bacterium]